MERLVILNPRSRHGKADRAFEAQRAEWRRKLGPFEFHRTCCPGDATRKVRSVLEEGITEQILIAGGDGSINEAFRGYWETGRIFNTAVPLGIINLGTGGDFYRTVTETSDNYEAALIENRFRLVDAATVTGKDRDPHPFLNISSVGMAGEMLRSLQHSSFQSGAAAYFFHTLKTLLGYRPKPASVEFIDETGDRQCLEVELLNLFACNGRYSGGGMEWAPAACLDSGTLQLTLVTGRRKWPLIIHSGKLYEGRIDTFPGARTFSTRGITVRCGDPVSLETDGEIVPLPPDAGTEFRFDILNRVFPLIL